MDRPTPRSPNGSSSPRRRWITTCPPSWPSWRSPLDARPPGAPSSSAFTPDRPPTRQRRVVVARPLRDVGRIDLDVVAGRRSRLESDLVTVDRTDLGEGVDVTLAHAGPLGP